MKRGGPAPDRPGTGDDRAEDAEDGEQERRRQAFLERARSLI